jgi:hypothetical protein
MRMVVQQGAGGFRYLAEYTRTSETGPWQRVDDTLVAVNATAQQVFNPHLDRDGTTLLFGALVGSDDDLYIATRATADDPFDTPLAIGELNTSADEGDPWLSDDGRRIYFSRKNGGLKISQFGIYYAER